jgi:hypothetical protein
MKRMVLKLFVVVGVAVAVAAGILIHHHRNREQFFFAQAFEQLRAGRGDKPMITIDFKAGGSASVILEHACCSGAGFDAVAIRTSDGKEFLAAKNYCGLEGFRLALGAESTQSLTDFTAFLAQRGYRKN